MSQTSQILGSQADFLLGHRCKTIAATDLHLPGPDFVDRIWSASNRSIPVLRSMQTLYGTGRLAGSGYLSILPVDQGIEHSAGASFAPNPIYFDSENIVRLAIEAGCNAVASTFGVLGSVARRYAHKIPFIVKINHNEFLSYPNEYDQIMFGSVRDAWDMGAVAVGATIYDYHTSTDLSSQGNHLGVTIQADIIKQKLPTNNGGYLATKHGKTHKLVYDLLTTDHPIDLCRYQVANGYMGRAGLINSGGESKGADDLSEAVATAVINKRAGGSGLILGRKAFQRPMNEGIDLLHKVQDVYLDLSVDIA